MITTYDTKTYSSVRFIQYSCHFTEEILRQPKVLRPPTIFTEHDRLLKLHLHFIDFWQPPEKNNINRNFTLN